MATKTKTQLQTDISASTFAAGEQVILDDIVDSYENVFSHVTTVQRDALTPSAGDIVYNTDNDRYEYWNGSAWFGIGQDLSTPLVVKIDISSAQILAISATPITVASAPGIGYALVPINLTWRFTYGTVQYTDGGASNDIALRSSTKAYANRFSGVSSSSIKAAANSSGNASISSGSSNDAIVENDSLVLASASAFSAGDGTLTVWVTYTIIAY